MEQFCETVKVTAATELQPAWRENVRTFFEALEAVRAGWKAANTGRGGSSHLTAVEGGRGGTSPGSSVGASPAARMLKVTIISSKMKINPAIKILYMFN